MPDDPYEGLGTPVTPDPYAGLGTPVQPADPYAGLGKQVIGASPTFNAKAYEPSVKPGEYPNTGVVDTAAQALEHAEPALEPLGVVLSTLARPARTLLAGQGVAKAWQNTLPQWAGGTPQDTPSPEKALGLQENAVKDEPGFDPQGNINWGNVLSSKVPNAVRHLGLDIVTDPLQLAMLGAHPGVSPEFAEAATAARDAVRTGAAGGFATKEAAQAASIFPFSKAVEEGAAGLNLKVPFGPHIGFVPLVPKALAPWIQKLDPVTNALTKARSLFTGPNPSDPAQLLETKIEGQNYQIKQQLAREFYAPMTEKLVKAGVPESAYETVAGIRELMDRDAKYIRSANTPIPHDSYTQPDFLELSKRDPALANVTEAAFDEGPLPHAQQHAEVMANFGTFSPQQQAAIFSVGQDMDKIAQAELEMFRAKGMKPNVLNAEILDRYPKLLKEHNALFDAVQAGTATPEEAARLGEVAKELPIAAKQYNSVPGYVPGKVTTATRELMQENVNPNIGTPKAGQTPDSAVRQLTLSDIDKKWKDWGDVKASTYQNRKYYGVGTPSTAGVAKDYLPDSILKKFYTKTGIQQFKDAAAESFQHANPLTGWGKKLDADVRVMNNFDLEQAYRKLYNTVDETQTVVPIRKAAFDGQGMQQLEILWKQSGAPGTLAEHMDPGVLADVQAGKLPVKDAITQSWTPYGRKRWEPGVIETGEKTPPQPTPVRPDIHEQGIANARAANPAKWQYDFDQPKTAPIAPTEPEAPPAPYGSQGGQYIHAGALDELRTYQRLGNDPLGFTNWMRKNAAPYMQALRLSKAFKTLWGPGAPGYVAMKTMHDLVRGEIGGAWDLESPGEILRGQSGHWKYADSGGMDVSGIPEYNFGPKLGRLRGADAAAVLERNRALGATGEISQEFQSGQTPASQASRKGVGGKLTNAVADFVADIPGAGRKMENFVRGQDNAMRSAALAGYLRQGMSEGEAMFRMERAFFDFTRKGPVTNILSQTGAVPFAAWQAKIIPFMAKWAFTNPGEFMLVQKVLAAANAGSIPASQVPAFIRSGTNIPVSVSKDKHGHIIMGMLTDDGIVPGDELKHVAGDPGGFLLSKIGEPLRALFVAHDQAAMEAKDPERVTWDEWAAKYGKTALGRPATILNTLNDPTKTAGEKASSVFNPMQYQSFDLTKQGSISVGQAKSDLKSSLYRQGDAKKALQDAEDALSEATKKMTQVQALEFMQTDPTYQNAFNELQKAQARVQREKAYLKRISMEHQQAAKRAESMMRAP